MMATTTTPTSPSPSTKTRTLIHSYLNALSTRNFPLLTTHFTPTATWWVNGNPQNIPYAGTLPAKDRIPQLEGMFNRFTTVDLTIHSLIVSEDGENAVVEGEPRCEGGANGESYRNDVVMVFKVDVELGKIVEKREYIDHDEVRASMIGVRGGENEKGEGARG